MIKAFINDEMNDWDDKLDILSFAYNTAVHSTTKCTPFELIYGRKAKVPIDLCFEGVPAAIALTPEQYADSIQKTLQKAYVTVALNRDIKMVKQKIRHDRMVKPAEFKINDRVWLLDESWKRAYQIS